MDGTVLTPEQKQKFEARMSERKQWYSKGRRQWSFVHHLTLYASVIFSAAAAVIPQLKGFTGDDFQKNLTSILAGLAALLISLGTAGNFGRKWRVNRISNNKVEQLIGELIAREPTRADIDRLNQIEVEHDEGILDK